MQPGNGNSFFAKHQESGVEEHPILIGLWALLTALGLIAKNLVILVWSLLRLALWDVWRPQGRARKPRAQNHSRRSR